jgi:hypothetical protein
MCEECENIAEVLRELVKHLPSEAENSFETFGIARSEDEKAKYKIAQKILFDAIVSQILEFADEIEAELELPWRVRKIGNHPSSQ